MRTFFFSSRRRHTRWTGDWSSDVCSSDLRFAGRTLDCDPLAGAIAELSRRPALESAKRLGIDAARAETLLAGTLILAERSEERRVGKEWRSRWSAEQ